MKQLHTLEIGQVFWLSGTEYVKTKNKEHIDGELFLTCFNLSNSDIYHFEPQIDVQPGRNLILALIDQDVDLSEEKPIEVLKAEPKRPSAAGAFGCLNISNDNLKRY